MVQESTMEAVTRTLANVKDMQTHLKDFLSISNPEVVAQLPPLQRAQAHLMLAKATTTLFSRFSIMAYAITPRNLYKYKLGKIIMTGICIGISYEK